MFANAKITVSGNGSRAFDKQTTFALASSLTLVGKEAQPAVRKALNRDQGGAFTIRNNWDSPSNALGIRVKPATKTDLVAFVGTAATFLEKFLRGPAGAIVINTPRGKFLAIPTSNVRRTKRDIIRKAQRPRALVGKRDFIIKTRKKGINVLFQRRGRGARSEIFALYVLYPQVRIREQDVLFAPTKRVFEKRFAPILHQQLQKAFATAR